MSDDKPKKIVSPDTERDNRIPPGQIVTDKWPIFSFKGTPEINMDEWRLRIFGLVENEVSWTWEEFRKLPTTEVESDWHCVTTWSKLGLVWTGVSVGDLLKDVKVRPESKAVMIHSLDGYTTNLLIDDFIDEDVLFTWAVDGVDLKPEQGWPLRLVVPKLYAWKSGKWTCGIEFIPEDKPGYWEEHGYHIRGNPWTEERLS